MLMKIIYHQSCSVLDNYHVGIGQLLQTITVINIHSTHDLIPDWSEAFRKFLKSAHVTSSSCRLYNNNIKDTQGHGLSCHVKLRCIISKSKPVKFERFVLLADLYIFTLLEINYQLHLLL